MKIAVDARELIGRATGVGRYLAELLAVWSREPSAAAHEFVLIAPAAFTLADSILGRGGATITTRVVPGSGRVWWEQWTLARTAAQARADVLFCPGYSGPIATRIPLIVTVHDVSFWAHPEWFSTREGWRRRATTWLAANRARAIVAVSAFSRDEIVRYLDVPADRIRVIHNGLGGVFDPQLGAHAPIHDPSSPLILTVGSIFQRRHVDILMRAFARIARHLPTARLVIVGENRTYPYVDLDPLVRHLAIGDRVDLRSYVPDEELRALYARASVFAFLSTYEGFGLTPLEALAAGVPTIVYDTPVSREIYGDAAAMVPIGDIDALATRLRQMLTAPAVDDRGPRADRDQRAHAIRARYSWTRTASATLAAIEEAARS
jgi:glycosyltransferase involved in cell wall biosynthesis